MYELFTDRARKVMQRANQAAQKWHHEYIGTEHILLGLARETSGVAANVLRNRGILPEMIIAALEKLLHRGATMNTMGKRPQTPRARKVIEYSMEESRDLNHSYIGTEHILLGVMRDGEGVSAKVLKVFGLEYDAIRQDVVNFLHEHAASNSGSGSGLENVGRLFMHVECNSFDYIPLRTDAPDGWPRTKDGYLVKPGSNIYLEDGSDVEIYSISHNDCGSFIVQYRVNEATHGHHLMGILAELTYVDKPCPPVTRDLVLAECQQLMEDIEQTTYGEGTYHQRAKELKAKIAKVRSQDD